MGYSSRKFTSALQPRPDLTSPTSAWYRLTVQRAILEIDSRGLDVEGIYRIPGKLGLIQQVVQEIEQDEFAFEFDPERHDVHTVAGVLKVSQHHK